MSTHDQSPFNLPGLTHQDHVQQLKQALDSPEAVLTKANMNLMLTMARELKLLQSNFELALRLYAQSPTRNASKSSRIDIYEPFRRWLGSGPIQYSDLAKKARRENFPAATFYRNFSRGVDEGIIVRVENGSRVHVGLATDSRIREIEDHAKNDLVLSILAPLQSDKWTKANDVLTYSLGMGNTIEQAKDSLTSAINKGWVMEGEGDYLLITPLGEAEKSRILGGDSSNEDKGLDKDKLIK